MIQWMLKEGIASRTSFVVSSHSCFLHKIAAFVWPDLLAKLAFLILKVVITILSLRQFLIGSEPYPGLLVNLSPKTEISS